MKISKTIALLFLLVVFTLDVEAQCAMCRAVLESEESNSAAKGINDGIVYLMVIPYILVAGIGFFIYKTYSKSSKSKNLDEAL